MRWVGHIGSCLRTGILLFAMLAKRKLESQCNGMRICIGGCMEEVDRPGELLVKSCMDLTMGGYDRVCRKWLRGLH